MFLFRRFAELISSWSLDLRAVIVMAVLASCSQAPKTEDSALHPIEIKPMEEAKELEKLRSQIPPEKKQSNDELAEMISKMAGETRNPLEVQSDWSQKIRKKRETFSRNLKKQRETFNKNERKQREAFLKQSQKKREDFQRQSGTTSEERSEFFGDLDTERKIYFSEERDRRQDFESRVRSEREDFENLIKDKNSRFQEILREYRIRWETRR